MSAGLLLEGAITYTIGISVSSGIGCTIPTAAIRAIFGPAVVEGTGKITVSITGSSSTTAHASIDTSIDVTNSAELGRWGLGWKVTLAAVTVSYDLTLIDI